MVLPGPKKNRPMSRTSLGCAEFPTDLWLPSKILGPRPAVVGAASAEEVATEKPRRFLKMVQLMVVLIGKMMINHETSMVDW